ncbi:MAG: phosphoribosylamine--glycine ligase [Planctomycetota bacterium]|nr:phosphoribosylamine--glycine ligase [Planctomycetota bacterium]
MNILLVGSGGREHALAFKIAKSPLLSHLFIAPGNPGTDAYGTNANISVDDTQGILDFCERNAIDLVVIGPEGPLVNGLADKLREAQVLVFGPSAQASELEGSKVWCKELLERNRIPTGSSRTFRDFNQALSYIDGAVRYPLVIKASGLAAGKGVMICHDPIEAKEAASKVLQQKIFGAAGALMLVEEFLEGPEISVFCFTDGSTFIPLESCQDHKSLLDGNKGPNTGGMGAVSPNSELSSRANDTIERNILLPTIHGMAREGRNFQGILFAGIMMTAGGPKVLEYNVRFGDPETQVLMMRLVSDIVPYLKSCADSTLDELEAPEWTTQPACTVILAAPGYPGDYVKGLAITGIEDVEQSDALQVFHAGTKMVDGQLVTSGGRVLAVTALGENISDARKKAYAAADKIQFDGKQMRTDIGLASELAGGVNY